ncbi:MAG: hypothetical protein JWQ09_3453 [Segetibacter sp.]|nr:hypothetical protein [Segetibacter sp.]
MSAIIYGPEYDKHANITRLKSIELSAKRSLHIREFSVGIEGLERFVNNEPLRRVPECAFVNWHWKASLLIRLCKLLLEFLCTPRDCYYQRRCVTHFCFQILVQPGSFFTFDQGILQLLL